jgi:hypothetical protein
MKGKSIMRAKRLQVRILGLFLLLHLIFGSNGQTYAGFFEERRVEPAKFGELSAQAKADVMAEIAESSYKILLQVPENGLTDSSESLKQIISARNWLEDTNDVIARILALRLQYVVDSSILNEMYRANAAMLGQEITTKYKDGLPDKKLVSELLKLNEIDEHETIDFALGLDTEIGRFCRENKYDSNDFLSGRVFNEAKEQMKISFDTTEPSASKKPVKKSDVREYESGGFVLFSNLIDSRANAKKAFLPMALNSIDDARDVRLLARLYFTHEGFANEMTPGRSLINSEQLRERLKSEIAKDKIGWVTDPKEYPLRMKEANIVSGMSNRVDDLVNDERSSVLAIGLRLVTFIQNAEILSEHFRKWSEERNWLGAWLNLPEESSSAPDR